jgi:hypothetical protein
MYNSIATPLVRTQETQVGRVYKRSPTNWI